MREASIRFTSFSNGFLPLRPSNRALEVIYRLDIMSSVASSGVLTKPLSKMSIFSSLDRSGLREYLNSSRISLEIPEEVLELRKLKYRNVSVSESSTEEEIDNGKESHVDSEDSGLFKDGYFLKRRSTLLGKHEVDQEVKAWKEVAEKNLQELNSEYSKGSKKKVSYTIPLGLEMNRKVGTGAPDDDSTVFTKSIRSSQMDTEDELDIGRNDEFMREVQRAFRRKKNPQTLAKRSLEEEYGRQLSKKMSAVCKWAKRELIPPVDSNQKALPEPENPSTSETGAGGDNTSGPVQGIFQQLSQMVLKNKISKNSKAGLNRKNILKRAEEKREKLDELSKNSEVEEDQIEPPTPKNSKVKKVRFLDECAEIIPSKSSINNESKIENDDGIVQDDNQVAVSNITHEIKNSRLKKVEMYLASTTNGDSSSSEDGGFDQTFTEEGEQYVFDGLAGEFLKSFRTGCIEQGKMSRNDRKLLTFLVKKLIERGELGVIDEMLCASVDDCTIELPPYENVTDREHWFLRMLVAKYIKRGMRSILEDKIAWIYYKTEASKVKSEESLCAEDTFSKDQEVRGLVNAFGSSGGNSSLNRLVEDLVQERLRGNANMTEDEVKGARAQIKNMIVSRFARMFLEGTVRAPDVTQGTGGTHEDGNSSSKVLDDVAKNQKGIEQFYTQEGFFEVQWKSAGNNEGEESPRSDESEETSSSVLFEITKPQRSHNKEIIIRRLQDKFWEKQQLARVCHPSGKLGRFCSTVSKRGISLIAGSRATPKCHQRTKTKPTSTVENLKTRLREENVRWLTEQKNKLWEARNNEARTIDKFTKSLPVRMERIIQRRDRLQKELIEQETTKLKDSAARKNRRIRN
ncbi:hypothetical protein GE061_019706 [Apolygus lucorum]|uniref:Uncharacterized protein n=1 Tax=Apolygus lucorum TaxID=248454 RepID=A0A6A4JL26_APOLU|nr:hypothetical protein GE061_019706 [Apolygus lucorum]